MKVIIELVDEDDLFRARLPEVRSKSGGGWDGLAVGQVIDCMVTATNKGGLEVTVNNLKGFMPASQVDLGFVSDMKQFVGQKTDRSNHRSETKKTQSGRQPTHSVAGRTRKHAGRIPGLTGSRPGLRWHRQRH